MITAKPDAVCRWTHFPRTLIPWSAAALGLALAVAAVPAARAQEIKESHHWILLLDVSSSFENRAEAQGPRNYRLRSETLSLLQTLLAARRVKELERRDDRLSVYVFGEGVKRVEELTTQPIVWADIHDPRWWERQIPGGLGARTDYFEALRVAVEAFKVDRPGTIRHLILISDGELDVGAENRQPGAPPGREELEVYQSLLRRDVDPLNWIHDQGVQVHALTVDEKLASFSDKSRQEAIKTALYDRQAYGPTPLERARTLVRDLGGRLDENGRLIESEGPYVMAALAQAFNGDFRCVRHDNVFDVLWETLFPEQVSRRRVPLGTNKAIVFAPRISPVHVKVEENGIERELSLIYDEERESYRIEPPGPWNELQVNVHRTAKYATWLIVHPGLKEVDPVQARREDERRFIVAVTNVDLTWQEERPPRDVLGGEPIPLVLDLAWFDEQPTPTRDEWRLYFNGTEATATGTVREPDGTVSPVSFRISISVNDSDSVLRLVGSFRSRLEGDHEVQAQLTLGSDPESAQIKSDPKTFNVLFESPLSVEDRFLLRLRPLERGELGDGIELSPAAAHPDMSPETVWVDAKEAAPVVAEWWGKSDEACKGVERLSLELPELGQSFGREQNQISPEARPREDGRLICYRSPEVPLEPARRGEPLGVEASDGLKSVAWRWQVKRRMPFGLRILYGSLVGVLLLLGLAAFLLRGPIRQWWERRQASFPLAVDLPDDCLVWPGKGPKSLLVTLDSEGQLRGEVGTRKLGNDERAVIVEPERKRAYRIRVVSGPAWNLEHLDEEGKSLGTRPLTRGHKIRFEKDGATATLRHKNRL